MIPKAILQWCQEIFFFFLKSQFFRSAENVIQQIKKVSPYTVMHDLNSQKRRTETFVDLPNITCLLWGVWHLVYQGQGDRDFGYVCFFDRYNYEDSPVWIQSTGQGVHSWQFSQNVFLNYCATCIFPRHMHVHAPCVFSIKT